MPNIKKTIKRWLHALAPQWTTAYLSARGRAHSQRVVKSWGCDALNKKLLDQFGPTVLEGPFAGLVLTPMTHAEHLGPYLLGVYQSEIDDAWQAVLAGTYTQIIDVGCKFGYYAVGLAKRYPQAAVFAFDPDRWARNAVAEMASANGARNVEVKGFCDQTWFARNLAERAFIFSDGFATHKICKALSDCASLEAGLFDGPTIARLRSAVLLIETHVVPGTTAKLQSAFAATHAVRALESPAERRRSTRDLEFLTPAERELANREIRGPKTWLLCLPKAGPNAGLDLAGRVHQVAAAGAC